MPASRERIRLAVRSAVLLHFLFLCACLSQPDRVIFQQRSAASVQKVLLMGSRSPTEKDLLDQMKRFLAELPPETKIASLLIGTDTRTLIESMNSNLAFSTAAVDLVANWGGAEPRTRLLGGLTFFDGTATGSIRRGDTVRRYNLIGDQDASRLVIDGEPGRLLGFRISQSDPVSIRMFVSTAREPGIDGATALLMQLRKRMGVSLTVIIRTDTAFGYFGGPWRDPFDLQQQPGGHTLWRQANYVFCSSTPDASVCGVRHSTDP